MNFWKTALLSTVLLTLISHASFAQFGIEEESIEDLIALPIGEMAPLFSGVDNYGNTFELSDKLKQGPVVLVFYRGYWCPLCNKHFEAFEENLSKLSDQGISVVAVTPELPDNVDRFVEKSGTSIPVVSDQSGEIMKAYQVAFDVTKKYQRKIKTFLFTDIARSNGAEEAVLPVPATYLIAEDGLIQYVHYDIDYGNRATVEDILQHVKQ